MMRFTLDCLKENNAEYLRPQAVEFSLDNTEYKFSHLSRNKLPINFMLFKIGLNITLVKFNYVKG